MLSPYKILGVPDGSSEDVCKKAYRKLCAKYHPDNTGGDDTKFIEVKEAYESIVNRTKLGVQPQFKTVILTHLTFTKVGVVS